MYKIAYLDKDIELTYISEIIDLITSLVKNNPSTSPYLLSITLNDKNTLRFGIGATPNHLLIFFHPYSNIEDCKISYNASLMCENSPTIKFLYPHSKYYFECNEYNLLPFELLIPHLHTILINGNISCIPCYAH